jgi:hypothetical protein
MKTKTFDCVRMKHEIQQQILREFAELTPSEQRARTQRLIESDPVLARLWRRAQPHPRATKQE